MKNQNPGTEEAAIKRKKDCRTGGMVIQTMNENRDKLWTERIGITICLWLCTVPFIFFLSLFFFDARVAWGAAVTSFLAILLVCNALCRFRLYEFEKEKMT